MTSKVNSEKKKSKALIGSDVHRKEIICEQCVNNYKCVNMNNIINKFLLAGDRFVLENHLSQP